MTYLTVIDTNVLISALLTKYADAPTVQIFEKIIDGNIIPLYCQEIFEEYRKCSAQGEI